MIAPQPWTVGWVDPIHSVPALLLLAVLAYRLPALAEGGAARSLWLALLALAGGAIFNITPIAAVVLATMGPSGQAVLVASCSVLASAFVLRLLGQTTGAHNGRTVTWLTVVVLLVMSVPLLVTTPASSRLSLTQQPLEPTAAGAAWLVHSVAVLSLLGWALLAGTLLCRRYSRQAAPGPLRTRLYLIGLGCLTGCGFLAARVTVLVVGLTDSGAQWAALGLTVRNVFLAGALLLIATGAGWPQLVGALGAASTEVASARSLLRLRRLWRLMVGVAPGIALAPSPMIRLLSGPLSLRERLYRRVMEIRDGLMALSPYADADLRGDVTASVVALGSPAATAEVVAEAVWITAAVRAKGAGLDPSDDVAVISTAHRGGADLAAEVAWLEQVARAHARCPLTRRMVAEHLDEPMERAA